MPEPLVRPIVARTLSDQATDWLRQAIQTGALGPGAQLVERELAAQLGISRVPIREAIQRLADEGLVKRTANRGAAVYLPSADEIEEITSMRIVLEQFVVERVMERWQPPSEASLNAIVRAMQSGVNDKDRPRLVALDSEFHITTWRMAEHTVLMELVSSLRQRVARLLNETIGLMPDDALDGIVTSHQTLIAAFAAGETGAAQEAMRQHITLGKERILTVYERRANP